MQLQQLCGRTSLPPLPETLWFQAATSLMKERATGDQFAQFISAASKANWMNVSIQSRWRLCSCFCGARLTPTGGLFTTCLAVNFGERLWVVCFVCSLIRRHPRCRSAPLCLDFTVRHNNTCNCESSLFSRVGNSKCVSAWPPQHSAAFSLRSCGAVARCNSISYFISRQDVVRVEQLQQWGKQSFRSALMPDYLAHVCSCKQSEEEKWLDVYVGVF